MNKRRHHRVRREAYEQDYRTRLPAEALQWLDQFMLEFYQGDFNFATTLHPPELFKDCRDRSNARRRSLDGVSVENLNTALDTIYRTCRNTLSKRNKHMHYLPTDYPGLEDIYDGALSEIYNED